MLATIVPAHSLSNIEKIISGGQTGVDRAALDVAIRFHIQCGGWCPKGRRAEDGVIPIKYPLKETRSEGYEERTKRNVDDSDGTLILAFGTDLTGGTNLTALYVTNIKKPLYQINMSQDVDVKKFWGWIEQNRIKTLNVAGPREVPPQKKIYTSASTILTKLFCV